MIDVYSDADFANGASLKSLSGMVLRMYGNRVLRRSQRQDIFVGGTMEAELVAMSKAGRIYDFGPQHTYYFRMHTYICVCPHVWAPSNGDLTATCTKLSK